MIFLFAPPHCPRATQLYSLALDLSLPARAAQLENEAYLWAFFKRILDKTCNPALDCRLDGIGLLAIIGLPLLRFSGSSVYIYKPGLSLKSGR